MLVLNKPWDRQPEGVGINKSSPQAMSLVAWWPLNNTSMEGLTGRGGAGTTNGAKFDVSTRGTVATFDGSDDYFAVPPIAVPIGNNFTISFWMRMTSDPATVRQFVFGSDDAASGIQVEVGLCNTGIAGAVAIQYSGTFVACTDASQITQNVWQHWTITKAGIGANATTFYRNGVALNTSINVSATFADVVSTRRIGGRSASQPLPFGGQLADLRFYNAVLPESQIRDIYNNPFELFEPRRITIPASISSSTLATSVFDGKIIIKSSGTNLLDGKVQVKDVVTALLDGKVAIGSVQQSLLDGKLQVKDVAISYLDGKVIVKDIATSLLDGQLIITQGGVGSDLLDGKIQIKDALTALVDGKVIVKSVATDLLDGKLSIGTMATSLLDGKLQIKDIATALLDGKIRVKSATVDLVDGKIIIADGVTSFSPNNQLLIDSIGGKVLQIGNSRLNTWNTAGRPTSPKDGTFGFNTQTVAIDVWDGAAWKSVTLS